ncbi:hypothetical protein [Streptomyces sp. AcH 505]
MSKHNPKTCPLCATLRHPSQAKNRKAIAAHLAEHPFPRQAATS